MASKGKVVVSVSANGQKGSKPEATVFVAVDTSGSMAGSKIQEVCTGLREIIAQCPPYVRFTVRKFDENVQTIVSKKKKYLDVDRLLSSLRNCGSMTALYDGIGQTINEIPYNCSKQDVIHVLAFTDGCDNASKSFNLDSVVQLLKEKMTKGNIHFTFIQAGRETKVVDGLESSDLPKSKYNIFKVEDTAAGIKMGFSEAQKKIKMRFVVSVASSSKSNGLPDISNIKISGLHGAQGSVSVQVGADRPSTSYRAPHHPKGEQRFPHKQQLKRENHQTKAEKAPARQSGMNPAQSSNRPSATILNSYAVWVGNIPKTSSAIDVHKFFMQWGDCTLDNYNDLRECKCAIITYKSKECSDFAVTYAPQTTFLGSKLKTLPTPEIVI